MMNVERLPVIVPLFLLFASSSAACSKPEVKAEVDAAAPDNTFRIAATAASEAPPPATAPASAAAQPTGAPAVSATAATPSAASKAAAAATAKATAPAASTAAAAPEPPLKGAASHVTGKNFTLDVSSPGCRVDTPCTVALRIAASGEYHVNKEYPYKFTATPAAGVAFLGNGDPNTFSRAAGDFHEDGEKTGTMTVRLKPSAAGSATVSGTYKMSICSADQCQIETQAVSLAVPVI